MNWDYGVVTKLAELGLNAKQMGQAGQCHLAVERTKAAAATDCEIASASEEGGSVRLWPTQTPAALADGSETAAAALQTEEVSLPPAPQVFNPKRGLHAFTLEASRPERQGIVCSHVPNAEAIQSRPHLSASAPSELQVASAAGAQSGDRC